MYRFKQFLRYVANKSVLFEELNVVLYLLNEINVIFLSEKDVFLVV